MPEADIEILGSTTGALLGPSEDWRTGLARATMFPLVRPKLREETTPVAIGDLTRIGTVVVKSV